MAKRYIGDAVVTIQYHDAGDYRGTISAGGYHWRFDSLRAPAVGHGAGVGYDSPEAYDSMAKSAVVFGSYYTTHNRGADTPDWAPRLEVADAIEEATSWAMDDQGNYAVRRSKNGPDHLLLLANPTGGQVLAAVLGVVVVGGVLYLLFKPKEAQAAEAEAAQPAATCTPVPFDKLGQFAKDKGYNIFYDEQTLDLTTKPPANPHFVNDPKAREYLTRLCSFFKWSGSQWIVDAVTDAELVDWMPSHLSGINPASMFLPGSPI
jgi:hypothetical protein